MKMNDLLSTMVDYVKVARQAGIIDSTPYDETLNSLESSLASKFNQFANYDGIFSDIYNKWEDEDFFYINSIWSTKSTASGKSNIYLMRYEDINGVNESTTQTVFLDDATSIINFLSKYNPSGFAQDSDFSGAFLFPSILSRESLTVTNGGSDHIFIDAGEQLSVPIVFEYFLDGTKIEDQGIDRTKVSKSIYFDIRNSLIKDPIHYMIEVIGNYDLSSSGDVYNNFSITDLEDNVTPED